MRPALLYDITFMQEGGVGRGVTGGGGLVYPNLVKSIPLVICLLATVLVLYGARLEPRGLY